MCTSSSKFINKYQTNTRELPWLFFQRARTFSKPKWNKEKQNKIKHRHFCEEPESCSSSDVYSPTYQTHAQFSLSSVSQHLRSCSTPVLTLLWSRDCIWGKLNVKIWRSLSSVIALYLIFHLIGHNELILIARNRLIDLRMNDGNLINSNDWVDTDEGLKRTLEMSALLIFLRC